MRMKTPGTLDCISIRTRPARREVSTLENLQLAQPGVGSVDPLTHLLTNKAFNVTTSTYVATAPPAWEQHPCLILLFTVHPGMDDKKAATIHTTSSTILPLTPPRGTRRQPPRPGFLGLSIILSSSTPSATFRPGLERRRSTKEQRPHVDHRGSHAHHRTQGLSPSVTDVTITPQGWSTFTDARRYSNLYCARRAFSSKALP
jgi:hypothetical protein